MVYLTGPALEAEIEYRRATLIGPATVARRPSRRARRAHRAAARATTRVATQPATQPATAPTPAAATPTKPASPVSKHAA
jgi:hypothetical protein